MYSKEGNGFIILIEWDFCVIICEKFSNVKNELYWLNINDVMYIIYGIYNGLYMNRNIMNYY